MSEVSASAQQSLDALLSKLGAKKLSDVQAATNKSKDSLGQEDFLKLMTTHLANDRSNGAVFDCNWYPADESDNDGSCERDFAEPDRNGSELRWQDCSCSG